MYVLLPESDEKVEGEVEFVPLFLEVMFAAELFHVDSYALHELLVLG